MYHFVLCFTSCLSSFLSQAQNICCRATTASQRAIDGAIVFVVKILGEQRPKQAVQLPPPPTKSSPLWLPLSPTVLNQPGPPFYMVIGLFSLVLLVMIATMLSRIGALQLGRRAIGKTIYGFRRVASNSLLAFLWLYLAVAKMFKTHIVHTKAFFVQVWTSSKTLLIVFVLASRKIYMTVGILFATLLVAVHGRFISAGCCLLLDVAAYPPSADLIPPPPYWKVCVSGVKNIVELSQLQDGGEIASGASGVVSKMMTEDGTKVYAVKKICKVFDDSRVVFWAAIKAEVKVHTLMADHPAFPVIHGVFEDFEHVYVVMDMGGRSLFNCRMTSRIMALFCGFQLVKVLHALHQRGVIHLDIKPSNLLIGADKRLLLIDYGISHAFNMDEPQVLEYPKWHQLREKGGSRFPMLWPSTDNPHQVRPRGGTPGYMFPPILRRQVCSYGADLWAVGIVMYEWLNQADPTFKKGSWIPDINHNLSGDEIKFFHKIFSYTPGHRFKDWRREIKKHPIWKPLGL
ncbi:Serine/threonine-protein phosphatase [Mycena venus]|uniref:Serine/threonine-protein phosphatase n=1 Tax=Mycena venus TaxID=2733690 RepID=A0A8H6YGC7_9AGAR|nr:Serine/threonine-protein phosphatase [Mycena venus]